MEEKKNFEAIFKEDLYQYLLSIDKVDAHLPEAPDLEELWQKVGERYLPDAIREFAKYPTVSLGWIMYVGRNENSLRHRRKQVSLQPARPRRSHGATASGRQIVVFSLRRRIR